MKSLIPLALFVANVAMLAVNVSNEAWAMAAISASAAMLMIVWFHAVVMRLP